MSSSSHLFNTIVDSISTVKDIVTALCHINKHDDNKNALDISDHIGSNIKHILLFKPCNRTNISENMYSWQYPLTSAIPSSYSHKSSQHMLEFSYRVSIHNREYIDGHYIPLDPPNFDIIIPLNTSFLLETLNVLWFFYSSTMNIAVIVATSTYTNSLFLVDFNYLQTDPLVLNNYKPHMKIHRGFLNYYLHVRPDLFKLLDKYVNDNTQILITGLSLGGALSTIIALDLYNIKLSNDTIISDLVHYSFASPRLFNTSGSESYNNLDISSYRICNGSDIITSVPFPIMPSSDDDNEDFTHTNHMIYFDRNLSEYYDNHILAYLQEYNIDPIS